MAEPVGQTPRHSPHRPDQPARVLPAARPALDQPAAGGGAVKVAPGSGALLILVPAYNEERAVGTVLAEIRRVMGDVPVLVVDDCSADTTAVVARASGAHVLSLPHHLGLGGCVQAGYKLAFELGYDYVIRVDGDGQHDPRDIPRIFEALRSSS